MMRERMGSQGRRGGGQVWNIEGLVRGQWEQAKGEVLVLEDDMPEAW